MNDEWQLLNQIEDVLLFRNNRFDNLHRTQIVCQFLNEIKSKWLNAVCLQQLLGDGFECEVLMPGKKWRTGKIRMRLCFDFCPDVPEIDDKAENNQLDISQPASPLDDLRQQLKQIQHQ
jgi:hypothetical protein